MFFSLQSLLSGNFGRQVFLKFAELARSKGTNFWYHIFCACSEVCADFDSEPSEDDDEIRSKRTTENITANTKEDVATHDIDVSVDKHDFSNGIDFSDVEVPSSRITG